MKNHDLINKLIKLNLNTNQVIFVGSTVLELLELREAQDIDIVISKNNYNQLKRKMGLAGNIKKPDRDFFTFNEFDIGYDYILNGVKLSYSQIKKHTTLIENLRVIKPEVYLEHKKYLVKTEPDEKKHQADIKLLEKYFQK